MVCTLKIRKWPPFSLEKEAYLYLTEAVDVDRCKSSTVQFESADPYNRRDYNQVVRIGVLEVYLLLFSTALFSYKVAMYEERIESRNIFRGSKKFTSICPWWWIKSPHDGAFGPESIQHQVAVWLQTPWRDMSSEGNVTLELWVRTVFGLKRG